MERVKFDHTPKRIACKRVFPLYCYTLKRQQLLYDKCKPHLSIDGPGQVITELDRSGRVEAQLDSPNEVGEVGLC